MVSQAEVLKQALEACRMEDVRELAIRGSRLEGMNDSRRNIAIITNRSHTRLISGIRLVLLCPKLDTAPCAIEMLVIDAVSMRARRRPASDFTIMLDQGESTFGRLARDGVADDLARGCQPCRVAGKLGQHVGAAEIWCSVDDEAASGFVFATGAGWGWCVSCGGG